MTAIPKYPPALYTFILSQYDKGVPTKEIPAKVRKQFKIPLTRSAAAGIIFRNRTSKTAVS